MKDLEVFHELVRKAEGVIRFDKAGKDEQQPDYNAAKGS
jgi:hypothetical protein